MSQFAFGEGLFTKPADHSGERFELVEGRVGIARGFEEAKFEMALTGADDGQRSQQSAARRGI